MIRDAALALETTKVYNVAVRLVRCIYEYVKMVAAEKGEFLTVLVSALTLIKCLEVRMWENSAQMLSQLPKIGPASVESLQSAGIKSFEDLLNANAREIEKV